MHTPIHARRYVNNLIPQDRLNETTSRRTNFVISDGLKALHASPLSPTTWAEGTFFRHPLLKQRPRILSISALSISTVRANNLSKPSTISDHVSFQKSLGTAPTQITGTSALRALVNRSGSAITQESTAIRRDPQIPLRLSPILRPAKRLRKGSDKAQSESNNIPPTLIPQKRPKTTIRFTTNSEVPPRHRSQQSRLTPGTCVCHTVLSTSVGATSSFEKRTLAIWLVDRAVGEFIIPNAQGISRIPLEARRAVNSRIFDLIADYCPPIEAVVLSLWYLSRLFPAAFIQGDAIHEQDLVEVILRLVILGLMFANKWLQDHNLRHTHWSRLSRLSLNYLSVLERLALGILDYNISISEPEWVSWLSKLLGQSTTSATSIQAPVLMADMRACISQLLVLSDGCLEKSPFRQKRPIDRPPPTSSIDALCNYLLTGLFSITYAKPAPSFAVAYTPAPWDPSVDPPILKHVHQSTKGFPLYLKVSVTWLLSRSVSQHHPFPLLPPHTRCPR
ncbi:hypothetical protein BD779DRAFT_362547 [Infundibulicybe gibba]|nr:hypothetical protein BD779DRAFT_362547 [Infundibulicybe gibba]